MGKKYDFQKEMDNANALYEFYHACAKESIVFITRIEVRERGQDIPEFICPNAKIRNVYDNSSMKIDIMWDEFGYKNYRDIGLFGYYAPKWCEMKYYQNIKAIDVYSQDSNKIVRIFAIEE